MASRLMGLSWPMVMFLCRPPGAFNKAPRGPYLSRGIRLARHSLFRMPPPRAFTLADDDQVTASATTTTDVKHTCSEQKSRACYRARHLLIHWSLVYFNPGGYIFHLKRIFPSTPQIIITRTIAAPHF